MDTDDRTDIPADPLPGETVAGLGRARRWTRHE